MKIEPKKNMKYPKYAAALAAFASAMLLTGCQTAGEVAMDGTAPDPNIAEQTLPAVSPDNSSEDDIVLGGEMAVEECETETRPMITPGLVYVPADDESVDVSAEPLTLEGDVAWVPDYQEDTNLAMQQGREQLADLYAEAFSQAGIPMKEFCRNFSHYGTYFTAVLAGEDESLELVFYDGSAVDEDLLMRDWLGDVCTERYEWGCVFKTEERCTVFVDITAQDVDAAANTEQVVRDVIG